MSDAAQKLLEQIRALPEEDRRWIADELWDEQEGVSDEDIGALHADPEFQAMLADRLRQVQEHPDRLIDGPEAMRMIRGHLAAKSGEPRS
jgi:hypothetical protein